MAPELLFAATTPNRRSSIADCRISTWLNRSMFRRHPLALQSLHVSRCGLVQQFLKGAPVVQTAPNFRHQFFWNVNRKAASLATTVQHVTRVLFTRSASLAILPYARAPTQAQRAENGWPSARRPIRQPARYIRR